MVCCCVTRLTVQGPVHVGLSLTWYFPSVPIHGVLTFVVPPGVPERQPDEREFRCRDRHCQAHPKGRLELPADLVGRRRDLAVTNPTTSPAPSRTCFATGDLEGDLGDGRRGAGHGSDRDDGAGDQDPDGAARPAGATCKHDVNACGRRHGHPSDGADRVLGPDSAPALLAGSLVASAGGVSPWTSLVAEGSSDALGGRRGCWRRQGQEEAGRVSNERLQGRWPRTSRPTLLYLAVAALSIITHMDSGVRSGSRRR